MLKVLIIIFIVGLVFFRVMGFVLRLLSGSTATHKHQRAQAYEQHKQTQKPKGGNVNIDFVPKNKTGKKGEEFRGGEYVEFEEVD